MAVKSSISLSEQQSAFARRLVKEGRFSSMSAVVQNGLDLLQQRTEAEEAETNALKAVLSDRARGEFVSGSGMGARVDAMIDRKKQRNARVDG